jgi:general secretion pathway protein B
MSYILEALKKAQAERQLGDTPTLHAAQVVADAPARTPARRMPMLVGAVAGMVGAGAAAMLFWRHEAPPQVVAQAEAPAATAPAIAAPAIPAVAPAGTTAATAAGNVAPIVATAREAPASPAIAAPPSVALAPHAAPLPARAASPAALVPAHPSSPPQSPAAGPRAGAPAHTETPRAASEPGARIPSPAAAPVTEEVVRTLAELPEAIQREVPKVAFGGYMYSPNAADRLVLVDKTLRHEGEELAPGLLLEKLLPKTAVLNYKGYRFRVGL